jgi:hypothetical protein
LKNIKNALIEAEKSGNLCQENGRDLELNNIDKICTVIDAKIEECKKHSNPEELAKLQTEIAELKAKKQFAENKDLIKDYFRALIKLFVFNIAISFLDTKSITDKGKDLVGKALTPQLKAALLEELNFLNVKYIPLSLQHTGSSGKNVYQVKIEGQKTANIKLTEILSEGEQKVIAIAGFLAELSLQKNFAPIVLDDPVSSLDHKFSEKIAERLVKESARRQVIIFTHDISFLLDLQGKAELDGQYCHCVNVYRKENAAGVIRGEEPWHAMSVHKRLDFIEKELSNILGLYEQDQIKYNQQVAILYDYLRETWEASIEECLFNKVVGRFQPEIKTQRLKEIAVEKSDCDIIVAEWEKCSKWMIGHDMPKQISENRPAPYEFQQDVKKLRDFANTTKTKRTYTKKIQQIPVPEIG